VIIINMLVVALVVALLGCGINAIRRRSVSLHRNVFPAVVERRCQEHSGNIRGTFRELSGNFQGTFGIFR
jgi:hypothetical protein